MPRLFDILRANREENTQVSVAFPRQIHDRGGIGKEPMIRAESTKQLAKTIKRKSRENAKRAKESYLRLFETAGFLLERVKRGSHRRKDVRDLYKLVDELTNQLLLGTSLLENLAQDGSEKDFLPRHITNVCVLSLTIGLQMNFNKSKLHTLGMAAIFHDLGMPEYNTLISKPRELSEGERQKIRGHALKGGEMCLGIAGPDSALLKEIIGQHHERIDGSGYPLGITGERISDYAKIIGLADTYEAITHYRPYRRAKMPHQAIREITGPLKILFELEIIKAFLNKISIYPVGSFVRLNTAEVAKVISPNALFPLQPVVLILFDSCSRRTVKPRLLDLSQDNTVYIKESVSLKE